MYWDIGGAKGNQLTLCVITPELSVLFTIDLLIGFQIGGICPVIMFPAMAEQAIFMAEGHPKLDDVIRKKLPAGGEVVTKRAVEVEEDGFEMIGQENDPSKWKIHVIATSPG
jgi:hypothetical protein